MTPEQKEREQRLEKLKIKLMMKPDTTFFTSILFSLIYKWDDSKPTAATDGLHLFMNTQFFDGLSDKLNMSVLIHEVLHIALNHITRGMNHEKPESNYAADYVVNLILHDADFEIGQGWLYNTDFRDMSYEQVYQHLLREKQANNGNSTNPIVYGNEGKGSSRGTAIREDILPPANAAEAAQIEAEITDIVTAATLQAKQTGSWGNIPGAVLIELDKTLNPKLPWNILFHNFMDQFAKEDFSWKKPNRRYLPDLVMPSAYSEAITNLTIAIDSSGSVTDKEFGFFIQELDVVQKQLCPETLTIINFNTIIRSVDEITQNVDILSEIEFTGRGGTNVRPVLKWAIENEPKILVIFTDGRFREPSSEEYPDCYTLWLIHNNPNFTAEQGEIIHYDL